MSIHSPTTQTVAERARQIGVSLRTLHSWKALGVSIFDDEAVRKRLRVLRTVPPKLTPAFVCQSAPRPTSGPAPPFLPRDPDSSEFAEVDEIIRRLFDPETDYTTARTLKLQADGLRSGLALQASTGKIVPIERVEESIIRITAALKSSIMRLQADLPPMLEGLSPERMSQLIGEKSADVLRWLEGEAAKMRHGDLE